MHQQDNNFAGVLKFSEQVDQFQNNPSVVEAFLRTRQFQADRNNTFKVLSEKYGVPEHHLLTRSDIEQAGVSPEDRASLDYFRNIDMDLLFHKTVKQELIKIGVENPSSGEVDKVKNRVWDVLIERSAKENLAESLTPSNTPDIATQPTQRLR